jgi:hypothetical protein
MGKGSRGERSAKEKVKGRVSALRDRAGSVIDSVFGWDGAIAAISLVAGPGFAADSRNSSDSSSHFCSGTDLRGGGLGEKLVRFPKRERRLLI